MRFDLRELLAVVAVSSLICAAFVQGGPLWETVVFSGTLLSVLLASLLAIGRGARTRMFWLGFAVAAGSYLAFAHLADERDCVPRRDGPEVTTRLILWAVSSLNPDMEAEEIRNPRQFGYGGRIGPGFFAVEDIASTPDPSNWNIVLSYARAVAGSKELTPQFRIGHCAWALLIGWLAGHLVQAVYSRRQVLAPGNAAPDGS